MCLAVSNKGTTLYSESLPSITPALLCVLSTSKCAKENHPDIYLETHIKCVVLARVALRIMCILESMYSLCHVCARLVCVCLANYTIIIIIRFGFAQEERIRVATARNGQNIAPRAAYISNMRNRSLIARVYFFIYVAASRLWCRTVVCRNVQWEYIRV